MTKRHSKSFFRYLKNDGNFVPIGDSVDVLPPGFYQPNYDSYQDKAWFAEKNVIMPNLYILSNEVQQSIIDDIQKFWQSEERYKKFGSVYKRNILLYSAPGNGKTSLINIICTKLIEEYGGIVVLIDSVSCLCAYSKCMDRLRDIEPGRKIITVIEDFERLTKDDHYASLLLQLLDGNKQYDNVVTIATTNYPQILEKRFVCRPSRFNIVIEYPKPNEIIRREYIIKKLTDGGIDVSNANVQKDIERLVNQSDGYTFDFVKELVQGIYVDGLEESVVFKRLEDIKNKNGNIKIEDDSKTIGFANNRSSSVMGIGRRRLMEDESYPIEPEMDDEYECDD